MTDRDKQIMSLQGAILILAHAIEAGHIDGVYEDVLKLLYPDNNDIKSPFNK
jgi:hypothetical protein